MTRQLMGVKTRSRKKMIDLEKRNTEGNGLKRKGDNNLEQNRKENYPICSIFDRNT